MHKIKELFIVSSSRNLIHVSITALGLKLIVSPYTLGNFDITLNI